MDTSERYVKMCEKATEIQMRPKPIEAVVYTGNNVHIVKGINSPDFDIIWLPRQDQLQEILGKDTTEVIEGFTNFIGGVQFDSIHEEVSPWELYAESVDKSLEQLWLNYVMSIKYHKVWNGANWIVNQG